MTKWTWKLGSASLVAFAMAGCSYEEPARFPSQEAMYDEPDAPDTFHFKAGNGGALTVKVEPTALWGPDVQLAYYGADAQSGSALRGKVWGRIVDVDLGETRARGFVGGTPLDVAARRAGRLRASGWVETKDIDIDIGDDRILAQIGECKYDLHAVKAPLPRTYEGTRSCGSDPISTTMRIPRELDAWPAPAAAAGLGILLSSAD